MKAMEVDEKPTEDYSDIGGLEKQIQELVRPDGHADSADTVHGHADSGRARAACSSSHRSHLTALAIAAIRRWRRLCCR